MSGDRTMERRLAAILSADVKSYSRLMGEDEEATIRTLTAYREVLATLIPQHRGRVVDAVGDNLLAQFGSVVEAVQCAVAIQRDLRARDAELPPHRRMEFRIGVNLGDVVVDGERLYGDEVNIAARLESLAEPGGICISGTVYEQIATNTTVAIIKLWANGSWVHGVWVRRHHAGDARRGPSPGSARTHRGAGGQSRGDRSRASAGALCRAGRAPAAGDGLSAGTAESSRAPEQLALGRGDRRCHARWLSAPAAPGLVGPGCRVRCTAARSPPAAGGARRRAGARRHRVSATGQACCGGRPARAWHGWDGGARPDRRGCGRGQSAGPSR